MSFHDIREGIRQGKKAAREWCLENVIGYKKPDGTMIPVVEYLEMSPFEQDKSKAEPVFKSGVSSPEN